MKEVFGGFSILPYIFSTCLFPVRVESYLKSSGKSFDLPLKRLEVVETKPNFRACVVISKWVNTFL